MEMPPIIERYQRAAPSEGLTGLTNTWSCNMMGNHEGEHTQCTSLILMIPHVSHTFHKIFINKNNTPITLHCRRRHTSNKGIPAVSPSNQGDTPEIFTKKKEGKTHTHTQTSKLGKSSCIWTHHSWSSQRWIKLEACYHMAYKDATSTTLCMLTKVNIICRISCRQKPICCCKEDTTGDVRSKRRRKFRWCIALKLKLYLLRE